MAFKVNCTPEELEAIRGRAWICPGAAENITNDASASRDYGIDRTASASLVIEGKASDALAHLAVPERLRMELGGQAFEVVDPVITTETREREGHTLVRLSVAGEIRLLPPYASNLLADERCKVLSVATWWRAEPEGGKESNA